VNRDQITAYCNDALSLDKFPDYGPMGLQFAGDEQVKKIATAVSVSKDVIERAAAAGCNLLIVHHGMFWNNESRVLDQRVAGRLEALERHGMTLLAYHLALDAHPKIGNNILLARTLGLGKLTPWAEIGWSGEYREPMIAEHCFFQKKIKLGIMAGKSEGLAYLNAPEHDRPFVQKVAVIAGGAAHYVVQAHRDGFDTFVTGEPSEPLFYLAQDLKMNVFAFGHDKTERSGVQALGRKISQKFKIPHEFIRVENPV
jgi:dinuclear metal center YbgI/SA1388 family protein